MKNPAWIRTLLAISLALRDYVAKSGISHLAVALSGGRDSAMVSLLVHRRRYCLPSNI